MNGKTVGMELKTLAHLLRRSLESLPSFQYAESITGTNSWIIAYLARNKDKDIFQKDLEKRFSINRSTASRVIQRMEKKGLIERHAVPYDARLKKLVLTDKAMKLHQAVSADLAHLESVLVKDLSKVEIKNLYTYINKMKANLNNMQEK
ncbi:MAG: helix-turn-helix domain-containing protein [Bacillota bacterium]|nr:helix-turn-helix domain-containing protein [Bacillota bacterium]